jgi:hypothetical protein
LYVTAATAFTTGALGGLATLSNLSRHFDMTTIIRVLDSTEGSRLLARPTIVAYDRVEARFSSISEIPVQELTQTAGGGEIGTTTFREAGITLTVLPHIIQDGTILMQVTPEFSVLAGFTNGNPIIDRRSATTTLRIRDGQTTVIGGLLRRAEREDQNGLPGLSKLKFFGVFFRGHESTITESELLVFIKAEIIPLEHTIPLRDQAAHLTTTDLLEAVPYASHGPITPYCGDPYCPYHHPRPWGSALPPAACSACQDNGSFGHAFPRDPAYYGPAPTIQDEPLPTPVVPPVLPPSGSVLPLVPGNGNIPVPPPVVIDEARRRALLGQRTAIRRLPPLNGQTRTAIRPRPVAPRTHSIPIARPQSDLRTANRSTRVRRTNGTQRPTVGTTQQPAVRTQQPAVGTPPAAIGQTRSSNGRPWWQLDKRLWWQSSSRLQTRR